MNINFQSESALTTMSDVEFNLLASKLENCFFLEVGANDGANLDLLYSLIKENRWKGILVEPDPVTFARLKANYTQHAGLIFENCAITNKDSRVVLYCGTTDLHYSLSESHAKWMFDTPPKEVEVEGMRIDTLLTKHNISTVNLLMIDVEGYDFIVLQTFPFNKIKPEIVRLEIIHIAAEGTEVQEVVSYLNSLGYTCYFDEHRTDIIGTLN